jgi:hypothetical protein
MMDFGYKGKTANYWIYLMVILNMLKPKTSDLTLTYI